MKLSGLMIVQAENLFSRLGKVVTHFKDWVVLGMVDVESLVEARLTEVADWEDNFKSLKAKGREVEKLPSVIKIDCITVSTTPTKTAIDDMIQKLFDTLLNALRKVNIRDYSAACDKRLTGCAQEHV
jgi:dynein heavy chain 2